MNRKEGGVLGALVLVGAVSVYQFLSVDSSVRLEERGDNVSSISSSQSKLQLPQKIRTPKPADNTTLMEFMDEGMRHQFKKVAQHYHNDIQYPAYSKPLEMTHWAQLNPLPFVPQSIPLSESSGLSAEIILPHFQITRDQGLNVQVVIHGGTSDISSVKATLAQVHKADQEVVKMNLRSDGITSNEALYVGHVSSSKLESLEDGEILVRAYVEHEYDRVSDLVATFALSSSVAKLTSVGSSYVDGADLVIPLEFDVEKAGLYRVRANLFDEESGKPISHLNASFKLSSFLNKGNLKAHAATLRNAGSKGPYLLTNVSVIKAPERPGEKSAYGSTSAEQYVVSGFDLDSYSREEYQNSLNTKRLEFLNRMASQ